MNSMISRFTAGCITSLFLSLAMTSQPLCAAGLDAAPVADALAQNTALRTDAEAIEQELHQRVALMEQEESKARSESDKLQVTLGRWMEQEASIGARMNEVEAEIRSKESVVSDARARMDKIEEQRQKIEKQMEKKKKEKITCYIPIAQLYCFFADLYGQLASLDDQLAEATRRWKHVNGELLSARNRLVQLREDQQTLATNQAQTKHSIEQLGNELVALHATLGAYRKTSQAHHEVLVGFVAQMDEFNALPPSQRPEVIERRLVRLRDQLVAEMGHACQLMKSAGPALPGNVQQACAKKS